MVEFFEAIRDFTETGGQVLLVIGALIFVMWILILERVLYVFIWHKQYKNNMIAKWNARQDRTSWNAEHDFTSEFKTWQWHHGYSSFSGLVSLIRFDGYGNGHD